MGLKLGAPPRDGAAPTVGSLTAAEERVATAERLASSAQAAARAADDDSAFLPGLKCRLRFRRFLIQVCPLCCTLIPCFCHVGAVLRGQASAPAAGCKSSRSANWVVTCPDGQRLVVQATVEVDV